MASRSPSPSSDETEVLPDRFDERGRPVDSRRGRSAGGEAGPQEMIEKFVGQVGDVLDGRQSFKALLTGLFDDINGGGGQGGGGGSGRRRR